MATETTTRCRRHCWHAVTEACEVCCNCGRGQNPSGGASRRVRWDTEGKHGRWYIGSRFYHRAYSGVTEATYIDHPAGLSLEFVDAAPPEAPHGR